MIVDAHVHVAHLARLKVPWETWIGPAGNAERWASLYDDDGAPVPERISRYFADEGADRVLLFCEYSPKATGWQTIEDMLPIVGHDPERFRIVANVNPHVHHPVARELDRQLDHGAVALKIHPVHAGIATNDRELYPAYARCVERGIPVIVHTGPSFFPGATSRHGDPVLVDDVLRDFPDLTVVLAHGGRGWSYDAAASLALTRDNVWLDIAGLPPKRLPTYYASSGLDRVATKSIFGTDSPAASPARNVAAIRDLGLSEELTDAVLGGNAQRVFPGL
ncbi:amidohydrolase family protein [Actinomycetospora endophytica]|uniref:Amidohydrolase family protein n=1 Tax=Actinomycetospora endophytica TaxID=2291215 RepID=A0ABS8PDS9_9PSEU|nr:amidohydrolase family protein [Actinomycetospora endophytica]MCD2196433.1 amidohydrolase family protein [Actinomycetospora endophytica]